jgi:hypothetical protein
LTRELFDELCKVYAVFDAFWDFIFHFGYKEKEADLGHPSFKYGRIQAHSLLPSDSEGPQPQNQQSDGEVKVDASQSQKVVAKTSQPQQSFGKSFLNMFNYDSCANMTLECAYAFHYAVRTDRENSSPWSIRQTAIYQRYDGVQDKTIFILVTPSKEGLESLEYCLQNAKNHSTFLNPFEMHRYLISAACQSWGWYIYEELRKNINLQVLTVSGNNFDIRVYNIRQRISKQRL